ncbi:MAG TPA: DUF1329 domain-containing protein [Macromonas sp.]|nr:DUF1329 domain-containing protein [Macromonas sp.]
MMKLTRVAGAVVAITLAQGAFAAVSADEAKQLGGKLTLVGAEAAGNKEGTIPPYSGKAPKAPASYDKTDPGQRPNPYNEKPLFSITAANAAQYADKLDAMVEVFKKYPNFRMDVYPSHRDYAYPKYILDNTVKNATACKGANDELKLEGCYGGVPFPIPKTGRQVMWNHLTQYNNFAVAGTMNNWVTPTSGKPVLQSTTNIKQQYPFVDPQITTPHAGDAMYWLYVSQDTAPARKAGAGLLIHDAMDMVGVGRRVYQYIPGQRRVKLSPNLAYDTPSPFTGGTSTMDDAKSFMGGLERFDYKLVGKKEKFIMYNNFDLMNHKACSEEKIVNNANFPHPDCVRWELHRVWKVEATLKPEFRHIYTKRVFFFDEDAPGAGVVENYDASGKLYRVITEVSIPFYDGEKGAGGNNDGSFNLDLLTGIWSSQALMSSPGTGWWPVDRYESRMFTPDNMSSTNVR